MTYIFDGSIEGLLTAVFDRFEQKQTIVQLLSIRHFEPLLLEETHEVVSDEHKAGRVWKGLERKINADWQQRFYKTFLSELPESFQHLFDFAYYIFNNPIGAENNYGHPLVIAISKMNRSVNRERHRMKAFIRFEQTADGIYYAPIEPDFNVLPLISDFFSRRYADQKWIIYDLKRKYGLFYDLQKVEEITFDFASEVKSSTSYLPIHALNEKEALYGLLWSDYFKNTNIPARKNMKLHIRHVPKRYWKYLTEKKPT